jgi:hypothetical protein
MKNSSSQKKKEKKGGTRTKEIAFPKVYPLAKHWTVYDD